MNRSSPLRHVARVVLEAATPFLVSGGPGGQWDAVWVADGNGLPTLPGSSLAGVLRAGLRGRLSPSVIDDLLGSAAADGHGSRLSVSWGCVHDARGCPVEGLRDPKDLAADPVLAHALLGQVRDHVRLSHLGAADHRGTFDERIVGAGHRFGLELEMEGTVADEPAWTILLGLIRGGLTIGGKGRRGFGRFRAIRVDGSVFDLGTPAGLDAYLAHPRRLARPSPGLAALTPPPLGPAGQRLVRLYLRPVGQWLFGQGEPLDDADVDIAPKREARICWDGHGRGKSGEALPLIPGSAVKGALVHRTRFHLHAAALRHLDATERETHRRELLARNERADHPALVELFGAANDRDRGGSQAGRVMIDDVFLEARPDPLTLAHVSIDRFTGGARQGFLFSEQVFGAAELSLEIRIDESRQAKDPHALRQAVTAFRAALADLAAGRLALGGGTGRGHGVFTGTLDWPVDGKETTDDAQ